MAIGDNSAAQYRYFVTNLVTNEVLAEIPFKGVSYERVLTGAGTFSANIVSSPETASLSLYESTMPGRTGIYAVRDGVCVWGGIIWSRSYNVNERVLDITASEFTSYFHHRRIWKTWGQVFEANLEVKDSLVKVTLPLGSSYKLSPNSTVRLSFLGENAIYTGTYTVLAGGTKVGSEAIPSITKDVFYVSNPGISGQNNLDTIPNGNYYLITVYLRTDTYDYVRSIVDAMSDDFSEVEFANTTIRPAKVLTENVISKTILNGVAVLKTSEDSSVVPGQSMEIRNVDPLIDGTRIASSVVGDLVTINRVGGVVPITSINNKSYTINSRKATKINSQSSLVTVATDYPHNITKGSFVDISNLDLPDSPVKGLNVTNKLITEEPDDPNIFTYTVDRAFEMSAIELSKPLAIVNSIGKIISRRQVETVDNKRVATITTLEPNDFQVGETVTVVGLKDYATVVKYKTNNVSADSAASHDFYINSKPPFHFSGNPEQETVSSEVSILGFNKTSNIISRSMSIIPNDNFLLPANIVFRVTTSTPHGIKTGASVTVSGLKDFYRIRSYSFSTLNNIATFFTGSQDVASNHNIQANSVSGKFTVSGLTSARKINVISLNQEANGTLTLTTDAISNLTAGNVVELSDLDSDASVTFRVTNISRKNNITTITTNVAHNLKIGDRFTYGGGGANVESSASGTFIVKGVSEDNTKFFYDNPAPPSTQNISASVTLKPLESWSWENAAVVGRGRRRFDEGNIFSALDTMYQGNPQDGFGYEVGAVRFQTLESALPSGVSLSNLVAVTGVKAKLKRRPLVGDTSRATTLYLGLHDSSNLATSTPPVGITGASAPDSGSGAGSDGFKTIDLPSDWREYFLSNRARGLIIGLQNPTSDYYTGTSEYMGIYGKGSGANNEPTLIVDYTYRSSDFEKSEGAIGRVTAPFYGYDGTYTLYENSSGTSIKLFNSGGKVTNGSINVAGSVAVSSPLNKTYSGNEIISKTANSITVQAPPLGIDVSESELIVGGSQVITQDSIFNESAPITATYIDNFRFSYTKTANDGYYTTEVVSEPTSPIGKVIAPDSFLNIENKPIIDKVVLEDGLYRVRISYFFQGAPITDVDGTVVIQANSYLNGDYQIISKLSDNTFQYEISDEFEEHDSLPTYGYSTASNNPTISYGSYGSFTASSDLGFEFSTLENSDKNVLPESFRGFELTNIGEELEKYTDRLDGFDYRVDCYISPVDNSFKRQFVMVPTVPPTVAEYINSQEDGKLKPGESIPIKYFGADKLVFEFPGNISDLQLEESAENAVTRFFMVGNIGDLGDDVSQPYAAVADTELLNPSTNSYPWPILDDDESSNSVFDEDELYNYAQRYMEENRPPAGNFAVSVNGSVEPIVGSYAPGDWCSLIINDEFVKQRLSSDLEPRSNILLRKIISYSVEVPDSVTFPERITLQLIPEWQVDKRGK